MDVHLILVCDSFQCIFKVCHGALVGTDIVLNTIASLIEETTHVVLAVLSFLLV